MTLQTLFSFGYDRAAVTVGAQVNLVLAAIVGLVAVGAAWRRYWPGGAQLQALEIDQVQLGFGGQSVTIRPNNQDRQIAYEIWVELATRKIGLPLDLANDVVSEIYDSWHAFFGVTRELVKGVPVTRVRSPSTRAIIQLSIEVLNEGLRPHLTMWQARFRRWYDCEIATSKDAPPPDPQAVQSRFPRWQELSADLLRVNAILIAYRGKMEEIVYGAAG
jgi:hypothetical protein